MADNKDEIELELPTNRVVLRAETSSAKKETEDKLKRTQEEVEKVKKQRDELKQKQSSDSESDNDDSDESIVKQATGYEVGELVTAPLHPPESEIKPRPVRGQIRNLMIGFMLMPLALIAWAIFSGTVAITLALVGAAFIAIGVLVRI